MSDIIDISKPLKNIQSDTNILDLDAFRKDKDMREIDEGATVEDVASELGISLTQYLMLRFQKAGYVLEDFPDVAYDILLITEAIKSLTYTLEDMDYPMHKIAEGLFPMENPSAFIEDFIETTFDEDE